MKSNLLRILPLAAMAVLGYSGAAFSQSMDELIAAAKNEGQLTVIALPHDWCGYGDVIDGFKAKYGLTVNELNPDAGSGDEVEAIKANKGNTGPQAPDVIDVGLSFGPSAKKDGLLQPYKVSTWDTIPDSAKDADGYWYGDYYGVLAFEVNKDIVKKSPKDWSDLLEADYKNSVALAGDPRTSNQAIQARLCRRSLRRRRRCRQGRRCRPEVLRRRSTRTAISCRSIGKAAPLAQGATPIVIRWDYNALADRDTLKGNPKVDVVVPKTGVVAGVYVQAISAYAPHPNAAKLWMEYLYSDEGQLALAEGLLPPDPLQRSGRRTSKIPADLLAKLPPAEAYAKAVFPTLDAAGRRPRTSITKQWDSRRRRQRQVS